MGVEALRKDCLGLRGARRDAPVEETIMQEEVGRLRFWVREYGGWNEDWRVLCYAMVSHGMDVVISCIIFLMLHVILHTLHCR